MVRQHDARPSWKASSTAGDVDGAGFCPIGRERSSGVCVHTPFTHQWPPRRSWSGKSAKRSRHNSPCPKRRGTRRLKRYLSNQPTPIHYRVSASQVRLSQQSVGTNPRAGGGAPLSHRQPSRGAPESAGTKRGATCCVLCVETEDDCQTHTVCSSVGWH